MDLQIYRCWIVYGKDYCVIILPTLLWMADTACACVLTWIEATLDKHSLLQTSRVRTFLLPFTSITIVQNILTTCGQAITLRCSIAKYPIQP